MQNNGNMEELDPDVKNLASAIRRAETGNDPNAYNQVGDNGTSKGGYQFQQKTWKDWSKKHLGIDNAPMTVENQNKVAYNQIKEWKDQGLTPAQIASKWNSGDENAYQKAHKGYNAKLGVKYDTPEYTRKVSQYYTELKNQKPIIQEPEPPKKDFLQKATDFVTSIFPGKEVGETLGTAFVAGKEALKGNTDIAKQIASTAPKPSQVLGDVAQGALTVGAGLPSGVKSIGILGKEIPIIKGAKTALGKVGQTGVLGAGLGATQGLKEDKSASDILKKSIGGAVGGSALSLAGLGVSKLANVLPKWLIPFKMSPETAKYAMTKKLGSPDKMLLRSDNEINSLGNKLGNILKQDKYKGVNVTGQDIYQRISQEMPDAKLSPDELISEISKVAKLKKGLIEKLFSPQGLPLDELHRLNSEIGKNTYKSVFDTPETKAGKQIGNAVYHAIGDAIKSIGKEDNIENVFNELSKEYILNNSIRKFVNKAGGRTAISLNDLVSFDVGGLPLAVTRRAIANPSAQLKTAGLIKSLGGKNAKAINKSLRAPILKGLVSE